MDRDKVKKVPDARVQDAFDELYDALDEIHKEIKELRVSNGKNTQHRVWDSPIGSNT